MEPSEVALAEEWMELFLSNTREGDADAQLSLRSVSLLFRTVLFIFLRNGAKPAVFHLNVTDFPSDMMDRLQPAVFV